MENKIDSTEFLPEAVISRIMKSGFENKTDCKISAEAMEALLIIVNEFISFITSEACDYTKQNNRKTIMGQDMIKAMKNLGFDIYSDSCKLLLEKIIKMGNDNPNDLNLDEDTINKNEKTSFN